VPENAQDWTNHDEFKDILDALSILVEYQNDKE
jgi:hypothetical protein